MTTLDEDLARARALRTSGRVHFFAPSMKHYETTEHRSASPVDFVAVSITGARCALGCDHCKGVLLGHMQEAGTPDDLVALAARLAPRGCRGLLVSGGADRRGHVPLDDYLDAMAEVREAHGLTVVVHTGHVTPSLARGLARARVACAMFDVIGDPGTMRSVYHLDADPTRAGDTMRHLEDAGVPHVPHVVVGLDHGRIVGEHAAVELIASHGPSAAVLVVLDPIPGTPMAGVTPPTPEQVASIMVHARTALPRVPVMLGCARPPGLHRRATDALALRAGLDGIAFPAEGTAALAREMGLEITFRTVCCSLVIES